MSWMFNSRECAPVRLIVPLLGIVASFVGQVWIWNLISSGGPSLG